ncbi:MAG: DUF2314 domain-containing protein [Anaerolineales bacterium]
MKQIRSLFLFSFLLVACLSSQAVNNTPTATIPSEDMEFEAAVKQAHDSWSEFVEHFQSPVSSQTFAAIKVRLTYEDGFSEDIWFDTLNYKDGEFYGMLSESSSHSRTSRAGKFILLPKEDMIDWMVVEDGKLIGGYTIRLAYSRMSPQEKEMFLHSIDYSLE